MKTRMLLFVIVIVLLQSRLLAQNPYGVWLFSASSASATQLTNAKNNYNVRGVFMTISWSAIQPVDSLHCLWTAFDKRLKSIDSAGLNADVQVWVGDNSPAWLLYGNSGVDTFHTNVVGDTTTYPYYKDPDYTRLWYKMIDSVIVHISKASYKNRVLIYESAEGTTGDLTPYKGDPINPAYTIPGADWAVYCEKAWKHTDSVIQLKLNNVSVVTHLAMNSGSGGQIWPFSPTTYKVPGAFSWVTTNLPNAWRKMPNQAHYFQQNYQRPFYDSAFPLLNKPIGGQPQTRSRDEFDNHQNQDFLDKYKGWSSFYTAANALDFGVDIWNINFADLGKYDTAMFFFNRYAGYKDSASAPAGFCVFHDGLDAADSIRFSVPPYTGGTDATVVQGQLRTKSIANALSAYGAAQDDPSVAQGSEVNYRMNCKKDSLDDVTWYIDAGNYERYVHQIDTNSCVGRWRIKANVNDTNEVYGRFARAFRHSISRDSMFFVIDSAFLGVRPAGGYADTIKVTYWDSGTGTWKLTYNSLASTNDLSFNPIHKTNTLTWKTAYFAITDGEFANKGRHKSDFWLKSNDTEDDIFAKIEVIKTTGSGTLKALPDVAKERLVLYPNPASDRFTVTLPDQRIITRLVIYDKNGIVVYNRTFNQGSLQISKAALGNKSGIYYLSVYDVQQHITKGDLRIVE